MNLRKADILYKDTPAGTLEETAAGATPFTYAASWKTPVAGCLTLVRNEALTLRWAAAVLGRSEVREAELGLVAVVNEVALIVVRFDRTADGQKLRLEDFAQILCKPRGLDYAGKYNSSYEEV